MTHIKLSKNIYRLMSLGLVLALTLGLAIIALAGPSPTGATITSDKPDYAPGETVTLTGSGWLMNESIHIYVNDDVWNTWYHEANIFAGDDGSFVYQFQLPSWFIADYSASATGPASGSATTTFTDEELSWDQCQNDLDPNDNIQDPCQWTNGALNTNNSIYAEGDVVPQRHIRGVSTAGAHYTKFDHSFYNASKDAYTYDFWATTDFTLGDDLNPCNDLANSLGLSLAQCNVLFAAKQSIAIPTEATYIVGGSTYTYPFVSGAEANAASDGVTRNLWISCGTVGGTKDAPTFTTGTCTNLSIDILGHGASNGNLLADQNGPPTADDFVQMKVNYSTPSNTYVAIWVGGHLAKASYWNEPFYVTEPAFLGYGASTAAGASFHQRLIGWDLNKDIGNRDNQIQNSGGTIVPPGSITIIKDDTSDSGTAFNFTAGSPLVPSTFTLSDDGVNASGQNQQYYGNLFTGIYTINELVPSDWNLDSLNCVGTTSSYLYSEAGVEITLQPGDNVTCTFTDSPLGGLDITKTANTSLTRTYSWTIDKQADGEYWKFIGDPTTEHQYSVSVDKTATDTNMAVAGKIEITNNAPVAATITAVSDVISPDIVASVDCGVSYPYTLASGSKLTCTYTASLPDETERTNTATVTASGAVPGGTGTAAVTFSSATVTEVGYTSINVTDTNGGPWTASDDASWNYSRDFTCPADPTAYTDGVYNAPDEVNTAEITETGDFDTATVKLHCYAPVPSKSAAASFTRTYTWDITKDYDGTYDLNAGETVTHDYLVTVDKTTVDSGFGVSGTITVVNPNPKAAMTVAIADSVGSTPATLVCGGTLTVPAGESGTCGYTASLGSAADGTNTATVTLNSIDFTATKDYTFVANEDGYNAVNVTDTNGKSWGPVSGDTSWPYTRDFTCPSDPSLYTNGVLVLDPHINTAEITETGQSDDATVNVTCHLAALQVTKTASGTWNRDVYWTLEKSVATPSFDGVAGQAFPDTWTVVATKHDSGRYGFTVVGEISIHNPASIAQTFSVADVLDDDSVADVTCPSDTVGAGATVVCTYTASPADDAATKNTATVTATGNPPQSDDDLIEWSEILTGDDDGSLTDPRFNYDQLINATTSVDFDETFACSADPSRYTNGTYTESFINDAYFVDDDQNLHADEQVDITCHLAALQVTKTAAGTWNRDVYWTLDKSVETPNFDGVAGQTFPDTWTVVATKHDSGRYGFTVVGEISIYNPASIAQTFSVADMLDDDTVADVTCPSDTVGAGATVVCTYTASPADDAATKNTATVTATGNPPQSDDDLIEWSEILTGDDDGSLTDPRFNYDQLIGATTSVDFDETFACSTDPSRYTDGTYTESFTNDAYFVDDDQSLHADAQVGITCHLAALTATKDATATYKQDITWDLTKTVDDNSHSGLAGQVAGTSTWQVVATKTIGDPYAWLVTGKIYIHNPASITQSFTVADVLDDGTSADVTCPDPAVVPAGGDVVCTYTASPEDGSATLNTATITAVGNPALTAEAAVSYGSIHVGSETAVLEDGLKGYSETIEQTTFLTWDQSFSCSDDQSFYTNGSYGYDVTNTATLKFGTETLTKNVTVGVDCTLLPLTARKDATATYKQDITWDLTKTVSDDSHSGFAGLDAGTSTWTVIATKTIGDPYAWLVSGKIYIHNPSTIAQSFSVSDVLDDGTSADVTCPDPAVVPAGGDVECTYTASPEDGIATLNTATITAVGNPAFTAEAAVSYGSIHVGSETALLEDGLTDYSETIDHTTVLIWDQTFSCSANQSSYINGSYGYDVTNTATLKYGTETLTKEETVGVNCYAPVVSKTAAGTYDERHEWDVTKTVNPISQSAFLGDTVSYEWTVVVTEQVVEEHFKVAGEITVVNPAPMEMTVDLVDALGGGDVGVISDCTNGTYSAGQLTVPANTTAVCAYVAEPLGRTDTVNNVTATLNGINFPASMTFGWTANVIRGSVILNDDQNPAFPLTITDGNTWTYTEQYRCSVDKTQYDASTHMYVFGDNNTATVKSSETLLDSSSASTAVNCYVPVISKNANGTYDEVHEWTLEKLVDPLSQSGFAGEEKHFTWTVTVGESEHDENFAVSGQITVVNPNPEDALTVSLSDVLNDGSIGTISGCTGGTWNIPNLVVPPSGTAVCNYSANPTGRYNLNALSAALPAQVSFKVSYPYAGGDAYFPVTTITNGGPLDGTHEGWCVDTDATINQNQIYTANVFSSYETLPAGLVEHPENFDLVNWIINQNFVDKPAGNGLGNYTYSDVQYAIWTLIEDQVSTSGLYDLNYTRSAQIVAAAHASGEGFMPTCGDMVAVVLQPVSGAQSITIAQVTFASLGVDCADTNVATAVLNGVSFPASATILWTGNPINPSATLTDEQGGLNEELTGGDVFTIEDGHTCSTDMGDYEIGYYQHPENNTAHLVFGDQDLSSTARTVVNCYAPVVTKTTETYWDRDWDWAITKDYDGSYNLFAGDTVTHGYKVAVDPTYTDNFWAVKGTITVHNYHPTAAMTLTSLTDLAGGINAPVTCPSLVVPANGSLECTYDTGTQDSPDVNPFGGTNTATAVFALADWTGSADIVFSATPTTEQEPVITVDDDNLTSEAWSANRTGGEWTYAKEFACSTLPGDYTDGEYSYSLTNTATINETGQHDTAKVDVTCYWPQIELTKTGDELSKIGDGVTYTIDLKNNTPTEVGLRNLACTISDSLIGFSKDVVLASGASDSSTKSITIPANASDPFINTASVTCKPVAATAPVVGNTTFSVSDTSTWSTNLFQPKVEITKSAPENAHFGETVTYTFVITNKSTSDSPNLVLDTVSDDVLGNLKTAALAAGCDNLVYNGTCTFTATYTLPIPADMQPYSITNVVTLHYHPAGFPNDVPATATHTIRVLPMSMMTDTMLCTLPDDSFRLIFTPNPLQQNSYKLNASNPGQFYYNIFYTGAGDEDITITLPYPWITQGAVPIHTYSTVGIVTNDGISCLSPSGELSNESDQVTMLQNYGEPPYSYNFAKTTTVTVHVPALTGGFAYINIHLDYGLKGTAGYFKGGAHSYGNQTLYDAVTQDLATVLIPYTQNYGFSDTTDGTITISSYNAFKKNPGIGTMAKHLTTDPSAGDTVRIYLNNKLQYTTTTDEDGWAMWQYKWTGKAVTFVVKLTHLGQTYSQSVTLKANGFIEADFNDLPNP